MKSIGLSSITDIFGVSVRWCIPGIACIVMQVRGQGSGGGLACCLQLAASCRLSFVVIYCGLPFRKSSKIVHPVGKGFRFFEKYESF